MVYPVCVFKFHLRKIKETSKENSHSFLKTISIDSTSVYLIFKENTYKPAFKLQS